MNPFAGFSIDDLIQIVVLFLIVGAPILRAIYKTLIKPVKKAVEQQARSANPPPQLEDFLNEVRRERESGQSERNPTAQGTPESYEPWEDVQQAPPLVRTPAKPAERPESPAFRTAPPAPASKEPTTPTFGAPETARQDPLLRRLEGRKLSDVADRRLHSGIDERELATSLKDRHLQDRLSQQLATKFGRLRRARTSVSKGIPGLPEGVGLREAMLIQAIFGPPRARQPLSGGWTVTGAGRSKRR